MIRKTRHQFHPYWIERKTITAQAAVKMKEEDLPDWIKEGRAAASVIVEFTDGVLLEEFPFEVTSTEKNEQSTTMDEVRGKTSNNHDSEAGRWNGIEISKDRVNEEEDCSIPADRVSNIPTGTSSVPYNTAPSADDVPHRGQADGDTDRNTYPSAYA